MPEGSATTWPTMRCMPWEAEPLGSPQELFDPAPGSDDEEISNEMLEEMATELPLLVEMMAEITHEGPETTIGWCDDQTEFEFGLDLILDGLDRRRQIS